MLRIKLAVLVLMLCPGLVLASSPVPVPSKLPPSNSSQKVPLLPPTVKSEGEILETPEEPETFDNEQAEQEADAQIPKTQQNPFDKPDIDKLITQQYNDDMWRIMKGALPCLETSAACLQQMQEKAVTQSPLLKEIDVSIFLP